MQPLQPLTDWQKQGLDQIFQDGERFPSPSNKVRVQLMYGQLGAGLQMHEVDNFERRLQKIMNSQACMRCNHRHMERSDGLCQDCWESENEEESES